MSRSSRALAHLLIVPLFACGDDDGSGPDGFDPADLIGTYALSPAPEVNCDLDQFGEVTLTIDTVEITDADEDSVYLRLPVGLSSAFGDLRQDVEFSLGFDEIGQQFGGATVIDMDVPAGITTVHGDGELSVDGDFVDTDTFHASIVSDLEVGVGENTPTPCSSLDVDVTGTRDG